MFIVRDTRKIQEILRDDDLRELKLARRPGEFKGGEVSTLCRASHAPQLKSVEYLNLYANKLTSLSGLNHGLAGGRLRELNLGNNKLTGAFHCARIGGYSFKPNQPHSSEFNSEYFIVQCQRPQYLFSMTFMTISECL